MGIFGRRRNDGAYHNDGAVHNQNPNHDHPMTNPVRDPRVANGINGEPYTHSHENRHHVVNGTNGEPYTHGHENRHHVANGTNGEPYVNDHEHRHEHRHRDKPAKRPLFDLETGNFNRRPSFGQWLKMTWLDILTMIIMGAIGLGVYMADPAPSRSFPVQFRDGEIVYPEIAYPLRNEIVPIWLAALLASLIPIFIFLCMQIRIRSFWDVNNAVTGLLYSLIGAAVFQVMVKWLIGGLRPHFLSVCKPDEALVAAAAGNGFQNAFFDRSVCRGDKNEINDALESMPSGHSTAAFAGFVFLYFYLNAKLKVFSNYHPAFWKLIALYAPLLGAVLIAGAMTIDEYHHWYDVTAGALIGSVMAISSYRMVYASVWDFRFNHIPLTRHTPFSFGAGQAGAGGFESTVFTHKVGWGYEEPFGGAPFDAAYHLRGQVAGFNTAAGKGKHAQSERRHNGDVEHHAGAHTGHGLTSGTDESHRGRTGPSPTYPPPGVTTNRDAEPYGERQTTPSRYQHHRKSTERKPLPGGI